MPGKIDESVQNYDEVVVPAGRTALVAVGSRIPPAPYVAGYECSTGVVFNLKTGSDYEVQYRHEPKLNRCNVRVLEIIQNSDATASKLLVEDARSFRAHPTDNLCAYR